MTYTKQDLTRELADKLELHVSETENIFDAVIDAMTASLRAGNKIEIRGFGSFSLRALNSRIGRNPRTGDKVEVLPSIKVFFVPSKALVEVVGAQNEERI